MDRARLKPGESNTRKLLAAMSAAIARGVQISNFFYGAGVRHTFARSKRTGEQIAGEVRAFYARRPRPWRFHGNRQRIEPQRRFRYRRAPQQGKVVL